MAQQIRIIDKDFSDPRERSSQESGRPERSRNVLRGLSLFSGFYSLFHKMVIPLALKGTALKSSPYSKIDFWFVPISIWLWLVSRNRGFFRLQTFLAAAFIVHGGVEVARNVFSTEERGWPAFSHVLSSLPVALCSIAYLSWQAQSSWRSIVLGLSLASVVLFSENFERASSDVVLSTKPALSLNPIEHLSSESTCGAQKIVLTRETPVRSSGVTLDRCGFSPSVIRLPENHKIKLINNNDKAVNFHFYVKRKGGFTGGWNVLVAAHSSILSPLSHIGEGEAGIVFTDAQPSAGLTAVIGGPAQSALKQRWSFEREPPRAEIQNGI